MRHLKRTIFTLLGTIFVTAPGIAAAIGLAMSTQEQLGIAAYVGLTLLALVFTALMALLGAIISKLFEDGKLTIFTAFYLVSTQRRKRLYHSDMGEFELIIHSKILEGDVVRQGFLSCKTLFKVDLNSINYMDIIKRKLDEIYKEEIKEVERIRKNKQRVAEIMNGDGYLDVVVKRDDKINKLGI